MRKSLYNVSSPPRLVSSAAPPDKFSVSCSFLSRPGRVNICRCLSCRVIFLPVADFVAAGCTVHTDSFYRRIHFEPRHLPQRSQKTMNCEFVNDAFFFLALAQKRRKERGEGEKKNICLQPIDQVTTSSKFQSANFPD